MPEFGSTSESLELVIRKTDDSIQRNVIWDDINWSEVDEIGLLSNKHVAGFKKQHGCIVWYSRTPFNLQRPLFYIYQKFWGKVGTTWHRFYITKGGTSRTPYHSSLDDTVDLRQMGWTGTITYNTHDFPVDVSIKAQPLGLPQLLKTTVTTPINLADHGIEYQFYLNPFYVGDAQKHIKWMRVHHTRPTAIDDTWDYTGCFTDYDITQFMEYTDIPLMETYTIEFLNQDKTKSLGNFNFNDVFEGSNNRILKIEEVDLPNGETTFCIRVGASFGSLSAGESLEIDPEFGNDDPFSAFTGIADYIRADDFIAPDNAEVDYIKAYIFNNGGDSNIQASVYDDGKSKLTNGDSDERNGITTVDWYTITFSDPKPTITKGHSYYFAINSDGDVSTTMYIYYSDTNGASIRKSEDYQNGFPASLSDALSSTYSLMILVGYTSLTTDTKFDTMVGSPTGWEWRPAIIDSESVPKSANPDGLGWSWGTATTTGDGIFDTSVFGTGVFDGGAGGASYIPSGSETGWTWGLVESE